jgi:hypothetical protein
MICVDESAVDVYTTCYHVNALEVACEVLLYMFLLR